MSPWLVKASLSIPAAFPLKPSDGMGEMKGDMAGGASVMAAISAIAQLNRTINVIAVIPATENMPGGSAFKPGDVLTAMNGKTIEIISTDAEGRLILADALAYTKTFDVKYIIDVATLTGCLPYRSRRCLHRCLR